MTQYLQVPPVAQAAGTSNYFSLVDTVANAAAVQAANYLGSLQALGHSFGANDVIFVSYVGGAGYFMAVVNSAGTLTLEPFVGSSIVSNVACGQAALASAGQVVIQPASVAMQFVVQDIRVMYSSAGLSGNSGNRLLAITDGTTVYNNAGITAALLGTPINTLFGGSGNPVAGSVAQNTPTVAGAALVAEYSGGTTDYNAGAVNLQVTVRRYA